MAISVIQRYLENSHRSYEEGRVLFEKFASSKVLISFFRSGSSPLHFNRLLEELKKIDQEDRSSNVKIVAAAPEKSVIAPLESFDIPAKAALNDDYFLFPEKIKEVVRRKNMHYRRSQQLFIEIGFTDDPDKRLEMAETLLNDHEQVNACWAVIDEYKESGKILVEQAKSIKEEINELQLDKLLSHLKNIPPNLSKDRKKLEALSDGAQKAKVLSRYQLNQIKLDLVKKRLEVLNG
jgi:hypothetical protein